MLYHAAVKRTFESCSKVTFVPRRCWGIFGFQTRILLKSPSKMLKNARFGVKIAYFRVRQTKLSTLDWVSQKIFLTSLPPLYKGKLNSIDFKGITQSF